MAALLAVLLALAAPSYQRYVMRAHRATAIASLLRTAQCQETWRAQTGAYDPSRCLPAAQARYAFAYADDTGAAAWTAKAQPLAAQSGDPCGTLELAHDGSRRAGDDEWRCWTGR